MRYLIRQSFDTFNIYGKEPEALANILSSFCVALEDIEIDYINEAFIFWLKNNSSMPTPSDIRYIALENKKDRLGKKKYENIKPVAKKSISRGNIVPWIGLSYKTAMQRFVKELTAHLNALDKEKRDGYIQYLKTHPGLK